MRFGPLSLDEAEGAVLANSQPAGGRRLKKGTVLGAEDIAALKAEGRDRAAAYREQATALANEGVDGFILETIFATLNAKAAIFACEEVPSGALKETRCSWRVRCRCAQIWRMFRGRMLWLPWRLCLSAKRKEHKECRFGYFFLEKNQRESEMKSLYHGTDFH